MPQWRFDTDGDKEICPKNNVTKLEYQNSEKFRNSCNIISAAFQVLTPYYPVIILNSEDTLNIYHLTWTIQSICFIDTLNILFKVTE